MKIEKILSVTDTRQYEEQGERFVPVTGSGIEHTCDRCGKIHEVHAQVRLTDGTVLTVGTGCMKAENPELAAKFVNADRAAKKLAELRAKLAAEEAYTELFNSTEKELLSGPLPEIVFDGDRAYMGEAKVFFRKWDNERHECLVHAWAHKIMAKFPQFTCKHGFRTPSYWTVTETRKAIARIEKRLAEL